VTVLQKHLKTIGACGRSILGVPKGTPQEVWDGGTHPRWMHWWAYNTSVNNPDVVKAVYQDLKMGRFSAHQEDAAVCVLIRERLKCPYDGR
jgi:hypothetical protein